MIRTGSATPVILAFVAAALWGLWWVPVRWLQTQGLDGAQGGLVLTAGGMLGGLVLVLLRPDCLRLPRRAWIGAALVGVAFTTYSAALNYTDVVRAILLFYLAPVWSKIIERVFLGLPWHWTSTMALIAALGGAMLLLGGGGGFDAGLRSGDIMAILSGMSWSAAAALIFVSGRTDVRGLTAVSLGFTCLMSLVFVLVDPAPVPWAQMTPTIAPALAVGAAYAIPVLFLTMWSAQRLAPATLSFLLTAELLTGVTSGAIWLDEPFGWVQAVGAVLILVAALTEVFFRGGTGQART